MKKLIIILLVLAFVNFLPATPEPQGKIHQLEARVKSLEVEVACLESYVHFILSEGYVDWLINQVP